GEFVVFLNAVNKELSKNGDYLYLGNLRIFEEEGRIESSRGPNFTVTSTYADHPLTEVSWYGAVTYCNWLSEQSGLEPAYQINGTQITVNRQANGYRLPTEAEWEYAARGGQQSRNYRYAGSNDLGKVGWYKGNSGSNTHPVGNKAANELELYDMSGNVWEWCWDWYDEDYYSSSPKNNPLGPLSGSNRVVRGGSWVSDARFCRSANRDGNDPSDCNYGVGFRLARLAE
ncbi:MAG: SUMF1/EgtB/PvdO family nonheme iron enzyme, partial [Bacteroidota bacterium]